MASRPKRKVIITCAVTGSIHTPTMSPHLPITPKEIADAAIGAAEAGAAIVHLHARDPITGQPTQDTKYFHEFAPVIKAHSNVVLNFTTGGASTMSIEERLQPALQLKPEIASLNMGSMNFGLHPMVGRYKNWKHDWEVPYLAESDGRIFRNTFKDIQYILESCSANQTRFEIECYGRALFRTHDRQAPVVHSIGVWHFGRHWRPPRARDANEANRRPLVWQ